MAVRRNSKTYPGYRKQRFRRSDKTMAHEIKLITNALVSLCLISTMVQCQTRSQMPGSSKAINDVLEPIRQKNNLPSLAGAIVTDKGLISMGAVGVRKAGAKEPVTVDDKWHLGSD